jgi:uncharacterized Zn finger protein
MGRLSNPSPCCQVRSEVRLISLATNEMVFRCSRCGHLRIDPIAKTKPMATDRPHLRLVVSH